MSNLPKLIPSDLARIFREGTKALKKYKRVDPKDRYVLLCPSSDRAYVGMGLNLLNIPSAEELFDKASSIVKKDLLRLCLEGPREELLDSLENRHLATYVTSHATLAKLNHEQPYLLQYCPSSAGLGVGHINSLVFSKSISFEDGLELVQRQAQAMEKVAKVVPTGKLSIRLKPATPKRKVCVAAIEHCIELGIPQEIAICSVTKQSSPQRIEISGHIEAIKFLETDGQRLFDFYQLRRLEHNPYAYNTDLMKPVSDFLRVFINDKMKQNPNYIQAPENFSLFSAACGHRVRKLETILEDLYNQPTKPVLMEQLFHVLYDRPRKLSQPNTLILWDKSLMRNLKVVNRKAWSSAQLIAA